VVRRPSALLIAAYAATFAYLLATPALPDVGGDAGALASAGIATLALAVCVLALLPARDDLAALALVALGAGLIAGAATVAGSVAVGDPAKALFAGALGMALARALDEPASLVAVPLFVAAIDVASVAGGPSELLARSERGAVEFLTAYLPAWGGGRAGLLGVADLVFTGFFAAGAWRHGLRRGVTAAALLAAMPAAVAIGVLGDVTVPVLPVLAAALLVPNLDRLPRLLSRGRSR
jgi:hypothetical protein